MNILILGGTSDARELVEALDKQKLLAKHRVIYSVAGLVRIPKMPCEVISGGFSRLGGLANYLKKQFIQLLLDVTHPFAVKMSTTAVQAAKQAGIPCWRLNRQAWQQQQGDKWTLFADMHSLIDATVKYSSVLLTAGQFSQQYIDQLASYTQLNGQKQLLRTAVPAQTELPQSMQWLEAIGPFNHEDERALLVKHQIDLLITKNSGGLAVQAKLSAARELGVEVFMLQRPPLPPADRVVENIDDCVQAIQALKQINKP